MTNTMFSLAKSSGIRTSRAKPWLLEAIGWLTHNQGPLYTQGSQALEVTTYLNLLTVVKEGLSPYPCDASQMSPLTGSQLYTPKHMHPWKTPQHLWCLLGPLVHNAPVQCGFSLTHTEQLGALLAFCFYVCHTLSNPSTVATDSGLLLAGAEAAPLSSTGATCHSRSHSSPKSSVLTSR